MVAVAHVVAVSELVSSNPSSIEDRNELLAGNGSPWSGVFARVQGSVF